MKESVHKTNKKAHTPDCKCSICGQKYGSISFKSGHVCETCIDYIKSNYAEIPPYKITEGHRK